MLSLVVTGDPSTWTVADVGKWLVSIEMDIYCDVFKDNRINGACLQLLDDEALKEIGLKLSVHRKHLLKLIAKLFAPQGSFPFSFTA